MTDNPVGDTEALPLLNQLQFYDTHKDHYMWHALPAIVIYLLFIPVNYFGNLSIVWATMRSSQLNGSCNLLIAITGVGDMVHVTGHFFLGYALLTGNNFVDMVDCLHMQTIPLIGLTMSNVMVLLIGVDRLLSVLFPFMHRKFNVKLYIVMNVTISFMFPVYILYHSYRQAALTPHAKVICHIVEAMHGPPYQKWSTISLILNLTTVLCYAIVWVVMKLKVSTCVQMRNMFKSLTIIMLVVFFSWILVCLAMTVTTIFWPASLDLLFYIPLYMGITVQLACAINFFVLYFFSSEYRKMFRRQIFGHDYASNSDFRSVILTHTNKITSALRTSFS